MFIQYGCGYSSPDGWRNFDASPTLRFERLPVIGKLYTKNDSPFPANVEYGDIVRGLPLQDGSCDGVYCSHVLEHLSLSDCRTALKHTFKLLKPGGVFRLVLPDLEHSVRLYQQDESADAASSFMRETFLGQEQRARGLAGFVKSWLGNSQHLWMWDYKALAEELEAVGFVDIRRAEYGDSPEPKFKTVEEAVRWENCLGIECRKPR